MAAFSVAGFILLAVFSLFGSAEDSFGIKEPYPGNHHPLEHTSVEVTCVAYDTEGGKIPANIQFERKSDSITKINADDNIYFSERREDSGRKRFVTLYIRNVTMEHDGGYRCGAFANGDKKEYPMIFYITVIPRKDIPRIETSKIRVLQRGESATISCSITHKGSQAELQYMAWFKDGNLIYSMQINQKSTELGFKPLEVTTDQVRNAGNYTCMLAVKLHKELDLNESDSTIVKFAPWFESGNNVEAGIAGRNIKLKCRARGYPLEVEWRVTKKINEDETITSCINASTDSRFKISRAGVYDPYVLSIANLTATDDGEYYCCLGSNCSSEIEGRCENIRLHVIAEFGIVTPFPPVNSYPIEFESLQITCVASDPDGQVIPQKIEFVRIDSYSSPIVITENERIYFTNKTEANETKLFVTLHIRNVTTEDDSKARLGRYKCKAYGAHGNSTVTSQHGFTIDVLRRSEIPKLAVPKESVLQHGHEANIRCRIITDSRSRSPSLTRFSWFKDVDLVGDDDNPRADDLLPLNIKNPGLEDVGTYTCVLGILVRGLIEYNVTADTNVLVAPWLEKYEEHLEAKPGQDVELQCSARGVDLSVEWKVKRKVDNTINGCVNFRVPDNRYKISLKESSGPSVMSITDVKKTDSGNYYCCLPSNCSAVIEERRCHKFTLNVMSVSGSDSAQTSTSLVAVIGLLAFFLIRQNF
ncbi:hemicentin-1-like isoform X2 [Montipora capricornis]|uniref:hemicentin-1-like isoform X2 n=1 Tax=Montipora capricornis TaxID=246305 RepID=UPI0035F11813